MGSTRKYFDYLKVKFTGFNVDHDNQQISRVRGQWFWEDEGGEHHKVNDLKFAKSGVNIKQIEWQLGKLDVANLYTYAETRIAQMFPFVLDEEKANDPNANFGLGGADVELIEQ